MKYSVTKSYSYLCTGVQYGKELQLYPCDGVQCGKEYSYLCDGVQCGKELQLSLYWSTVWTKLKGYSFCMIQFYSDFASK